jgi:hypothetical protein
MGGIQISCYGNLISREVVDVPIYEGGGWRVEGCFRFDREKGFFFVNYIKSANDKYRTTISTMEPKQTLHPPPLHHLKN